MGGIVVGGKAPDFELMTDAGVPFRLSAQRGSPVVLFFYPEDDTEGCTLENIEFGQRLGEFERLGVRVLGISPDSVETHCKFRDKHGLKVPLAADLGHKVASAYGVWGKKKLFGRVYDGIIRTTFAVDANGLIAGIWRVTRIKGHAQSALDAVREMLRA